MNASPFPDCFRALTGVAPFPWQTALFERFVAGDFPSSANLPTGLGKTSVVAIWLIALATHPERMPRRLVYVVNRRTVVDQTTDEVEKLRRNLGVADLEASLKKLCAMPCDHPLAISSLRGQFADNREWSADPCRPAVIIGTVDMIGSRLLFSGYGSGFKTRPLHAGFLGQNVLLVHDEAHLEPAFQTLICAIEAEQKSSPDARKLRVLELSATPRALGVPFTLTPADADNPIVKRRIHAPKRLQLHPVGDEKKDLLNNLIDLANARKDSGCAIIIFARAVETVEKIAAEIRKLGLAHAPLTLTGTLRGKERDELVNKPVFQRFRPAPASGTAVGIIPATGTVYLICTSAGEVGVNISADHLVCDLNTFESMTQRFGRVNRFGDRSDTEIDVVHPLDFDVDDAFDMRREKTLALLQQLNGDASPAALGRLDQASRLAAFSPEPEILPTSDILFDSWSLTSVRGALPGRPPVAPYLLVCHPTNRRKPKLHGVPRSKRSSRSKGVSPLVVKSKPRAIMLAAD